MSNQENEAPEEAPIVDEEPELETQTRVAELRTDGTGVIPAVPPLRKQPEAGTADVRVRLGFTLTHEFIVPSLELRFTQEAWTNVPLEQLAEISQIAAENQVLLDIVEGDALVKK